VEETINYTKETNTLEKWRDWINGKLEEGAALAIWKLPHSNEINVIVDNNVEKGSGRIRNFESRKGFLFAPFNENSNWYFLHSLTVIRLKFDNRNLEIIDGEPADWPKSTSHLEKKSQGKRKVSFYTGNVAKPIDTDAEHFKNIVENAIQRIDDGQFEKVVPARKWSRKTDENFDLLDIYQKAANQYPRAMVSLVSIPKVGTWLGASPETLIQMDQNGIFKTVALAGTQAFQNQDLRDVTWTQKEIEEQAFVSRYIINCFKKIRLREFDEIGPKSSISGNLIHLKTEFRVDTVKTNFPDLPQVMLELLHPTSAVCGMPKEPALAFLQLQEGFDREFFSGYLGPIGINNEMHVFVNLRCMQVNDNSVTFYAGAGVTQDSVPEKEWLETKIKMETLNSLLT
jgi:isochorismate synthase